MGVCSGGGERERALKRSKVVGVDWWMGVGGEGDDGRALKRLKAVGCD